jgi:predicted dehydrogenase
MTIQGTRRQLMVGAGATAAGLMTAGFRAAEDRPMGYAIVGLGGYAEIIMSKFAQCRSSRLTALVSGTPEKLARFGAQYGVPESGRYSYDTFDSIRDNPDVDIVYVILPNSMHAEYTIRAAQAGKHVLCEKPMSNTAAEAEAMIAACRAAGRKLMIGYRCHFEAANREAIRVVRDGELGKLSVITAEHGFNAAPNQWRLNKALAGGGSLMDIGIYSLQAARYLTGEEPIAVSAMESTDKSDPRFAEVEDRINFQLKFPSGVIADCVSTYSANYNRYRAVGSERAIDLEPATAYEGNRIRIGNPWAPMEAHTPPPMPINQFSAMLDHLSDCARTGAEPIVPGEEGLRDMRLIEAIYRSAREGRTIAL